jgi:PEP-CTERM motif-containing protein
MRAFIPIAALGLTALGALAPSARAAPINYVFTLAPENGSGVTGSGTMTLNGTLLTMSVTATGLVAGQIHPMHIHGLLGAAAPATQPPPPSADTNHDGFVESPEGAIFAGPPIFDLPATGTPGGYSTAPGGTISFTQTYDLANSAFYDPMHMGLNLTLADIEGTTGGNTVPLVDRLIEIHGLANVPASAALVNGTPAQPGTLVYDAEMPVAGGMIRLAAVPEPASILLLGGAIAAAGLRRRRAPSQS